MPVPGIFRAERNRIVTGKAPEMVDTDHVIPGFGALQALHPPAVAVFFVQIPAIQRISPKLTVFIEAVRRAACHGDGGQCFVQ